MSENPALRRSLLALAMLAVLLLSTGAAWLLSRSAAVRVKAGAEIVKAIRDKGLATYWGDEERTEWLLVYADQKVVGWQVLQQRPAEEGYAGGEIAVGVQSGRVATQAISNWQLNETARTGSYLSNLSVAAGDKRITQIRLADGKVTTRQQTAMGPVQAASAVPDNYLPEGTMMLAALLVAQRGADAQFALIDDALPGRGGVVHFAAMRMRYQGKLKQKDGSEVWEVLQTYGDSTRKLRLSPDGRIAAIVSNTEVVLPATEEEVAKHFQKVPGQLLQPRTTAPSESLMGWVEQFFRGV